MSKVTIPDDWHDFVIVGVVLVAMVLLYALVDPLGGGPLQRARTGLLFVGFIMAVWFVAIWL
jgi:hypothetical protein